jgi:hypothetical protein
MDSKKHHHHHHHHHQTTHHRLKTGDMSELDPNRSTTTQQLHQLADSSDHTTLQAHLPLTPGDSVTVVTASALRPHVPTTVQIGGKGTVRRRRLRKTGKDQDLSNSEAMYQFLNKFQFRDYGKLERVTFVADNGTLTSYDSVNLSANLKNHFYHLNLSQYAAAQRKRSKTKLTEQQMVKIPGMRVETAQDLLSASVDGQEVRELVGADGVEFLIDLENATTTSDELNKTASGEFVSPFPLTVVSANQEQQPLSEFIPDLVDDFEALSNLEEKVSSREATPTSPVLSKQDSFSKFERSLTTDTSLEMSSSNEEVDALVSAAAVAAATAAIGSSRRVSYNSLSKLSASNLETIVENVSGVTSGSGDSSPSETTPPRSDDNVPSETISSNGAQKKSELSKKKKKVRKRVMGNKQKSLKNE